MNRPLAAPFLLAGLAIAGITFFILNGQPGVSDSKNEPGLQKEIPQGIRKDRVIPKRDGAISPPEEIEIGRTNSSISTLSQESQIAVDSTYERILRLMQSELESDDAKDHEYDLELSLIWLEDEITSRVLRQTYKEDFGGIAPEFLLVAARKSNSLELSQDWKPATLNNAVLQPLKRLALSRGYQLETTPNGDLKGLSIDLFNHQRKYLSEYSRLLSNRQIRVLVVADRASQSGLLDHEINRIVELDPVVIELGQQLSEMDSAYIQEFLRLIPKSE